jgi:hypothetical protein
MLKELERRYKLLDKAKDNPELQALINERCRQDILYFFKNFLYTDKNWNLYGADMPDILPFVPYEFQEECILEVWDSINKGESVFIEKSRQMGISWLIMAIFVYWFVFHNHKYLVLSQKQDDVDKLGDMKSLFEKARFMIKRLPVWMLPKGFNKNEDMSYMKISRPDGTGSITGESANPNASRWGTYNAILPDEFAFQSNASTINKAMASASPCRIYTSTPNGRGCEHYRMKLLATPRIDKEGNTIPAVIKWLRYHWSEHPLYTQERYRKKTASMDAVTIAQELEINYDTAVVGRVYSEFPVESSKVEYDPSKPLYVSIDNSHGWVDPHAVIVIQPDGAYWNCIDYIEFNSTPEDIACFLSCQPRMQLNDQMVAFLERYREYNRKRAIFISDPYDTKSAMGNSTILEDYRKVGINLMLPEERKKEEQILKTRTNLYRIRYNDNCLDFASCILNARYPERKEDSNSTKTFTLPVHNRTSHARTALEYFVTYICENPLVDKWDQILKDDRPRKDPYTWRLIYTNSLANR